MLYHESAVVLHIAYENITYLQNYDVQNLFSVPKPGLVEVDRKKFLFPKISYKT